MKPVSYKWSLINIVCEILLLLNQIVYVDDNIIYVAQKGIFNLNDK